MRTTRLWLLVVLVAASCGEDETYQCLPGYVGVTGEEKCVLRALDPERAHLCVQFVGRQPEVTTDEVGNTTIVFDTPPMTEVAMNWAEEGADGDTHVQIDGVYNDPHCPPGYWFLENVAPDPVIFGMDWDADGYEEGGACFSVPADSEVQIFEPYLDLDPVENALRLAPGLYRLNDEQRAYDLQERLRGLRYDEEEERWILGPYLPPTLGDGGVTPFVYGPEECAERVELDELNVKLADLADTTPFEECRVVVWDGQNSDSKWLPVYPPDREGRAYICASFEIPTTARSSPEPTHRRYTYRGRDGRLHHYLSPLSP